MFSRFWIITKCQEISAEIYCLKFLYTAKTEQLRFKISCYPFVYNWPSSTHNSHSVIPIFIRFSITHSYKVDFLVRSFSSFFFCALTIRKIASEWSKNFFPSFVRLEKIGSIFCKISDSIITMKLSFMPCLGFIWALF